MPPEGQTVFGTQAGYYMARNSWARLTVGVRNAAKDKTVKFNKFDASLGMILFAFFDPIGFWDLKTARDSGGAELYQQRYFKYSTAYTSAINKWLDLSKLESKSASQKRSLAHYVAEAISHLRKLALLRNISFDKYFNDQVAKQTNETLKNVLRREKAKQDQFKIPWIVRNVIAPLYSVAGFLVGTALIWRPIINITGKFLSSGKGAYLPLTSSTNPYEDISYKMEFAKLVSGVVLIGSLVGFLGLAYGFTAVASAVTSSGAAIMGMLGIGVMAGFPPLAMAAIFTVAAIAAGVATTILLFKGMKLAAKAVHAVEHWWSKPHSHRSMSLHSVVSESPVDSPKVVPMASPSVKAANGPTGRDAYVEITGRLPSDDGIGSINAHPSDVARKPPFGEKGFTVNDNTTAVSAGTGI